MTHLPKDWRFLRLAWIYAVVLTGNSTRASELVDSVFGEVGRRQDVVSIQRRRRLLFALLRREGAGMTRCVQSDFTGPAELFMFHQLQEPGRSALALFYSRLFGAHQLADVLGIHERDLPGILTAARAELAEKVSVFP
jgi:hypothetical protein